MINDGTARYRFPEKETMIFRIFEKGLSGKRCFTVKFLFVSLKKSAKSTVNILETVASPILVKKDLIKRGAESILVKSAPIPSTMIASRGKIKNKENKLIMDT